VVEFLFGKGADINSKDGDGQTALLYAAKRSFNQTAAFLLENGAEVDVQGNKQGATALILAAGWGNVELVQMLLDHGADPSVTDRFGQTARMAASDRGNLAVLEILPEPPTVGALSQ
jgi:ankyrin repeat protein